MVAKKIQNICFYREFGPLFEESSLLPRELLLLLMKVVFLRTSFAP
jgi:hypothetical protein